MELFSILCKDLKRGKTEKESKRVDICICITESLCCTAETNTIL